jgi:hypothetical protein
MGASWKKKHTLSKFGSILTALYSPPPPLPPENVFYSFLTANVIAVLFCWPRARFSMCITFIIITITKGFTEHAENKERREAFTFCCTLIILCIHFSVVLRLTVTQNNRLSWPSKYYKPKTSNWSKELNTAISVWTRPLWTKTGIIIITLVRWCHIWIVGLKVLQIWLKSVWQLVHL